MSEESKIILNQVVQGESGMSPLVILHGLFGSTSNWRGMARKLAENNQVISLDLRNHGESPWTDSMNYAAMADDVHKTLVASAVQYPVVLGHSMGGKTAMALALESPIQLSALIVADIAPVAYQHDHEEFIDAMEGMDLSRVSRRSEADQQLAETIPETGIRQFLLQNLVRDDDTYRWRINLEVIRRSMPNLLDWNLSGQSDIPCLFIHGGNSHYLSPAGREAARHHFPNAEFVTIPDAGHWLHAEQPAAFLKGIRNFLHRQGAR